jgi:hypothetical protein
MDPKRGRLVNEHDVWLTNTVKSVPEFVLVDVHYMCVGFRTLALRICSSAKHNAERIRLLMNGFILARDRHISSHALLVAACNQWPKVFTNDAIFVHSRKGSSGCNVMMKIL